MMQLFMLSCRILLAEASVLALVCLAMACGSSSTTTPDVVLEDVRLLDLERGVTVGPVHVAIRGGKIQSIGTERVDGRVVYEANRLLAVEGKEWSLQHEALIVETFDWEACERMIEELARAGVCQVPTLVRERYHHDRDYALRLARSAGEAQIPADEAAMWRRTASELEKDACTERRKHVDTAYWEAQKRILRMMNRAGVRIVAGTDLGSDFVRPGVSLHDELSQLVAVGLSDLDALRAATTNARHCLGESRDTELLTPGAAADLVILGANPLDDVRNTRQIRAVVLRGKLLESPGRTQERASGTK